MNRISRLDFLKGGMAVAMLPSIAVAGGPRRLRFGALSDVHASRKMSSVERVFKPALEWFRDQGVDAVVCTGDLANLGIIEELQRVADAWRTVFPGDKLPDGRHVEKVFLYGNHDTTTTGRHPGDELNKELIFSDPAGAWEHCFQEKYGPVCMKNVNGYNFVVAHWKGGSGSVKGAPEFVKSHQAELAGDKPFFYCQHAPLRGTVNPYSGHFDGGDMTKTLNAFPNAFALTGHSHTSLTDETSIWQGGFTAMCCGACTNSGRRYMRPWFENSDVPGSPDAAYPKRKGAQMPELATWKDGGQGALVDVYDDRIVIHRHSFIFNEPNGPDWVVPLPLGSVKPYLIDARREASEAPEFAPDAVLVAEERDGKNREKEPMRQLAVSFPATVRGSRPFAYEVSVASDDPGVKPLVRCFLSPDYHLPPTHIVKRAECLLAVCDLPPAGHRHITVRAFNSLRKYSSSRLTAVV